MGTVLICAHFHTREEDFAVAVEALLREMGAKVDKFQNLHGTITILGTDMSPHPPKTVDVEIPLAPAESGPEITVGIAAADTVAVASPPVPSPTPPTGEVCLKNLSSVCAVPFRIDSSMKCTELKVQDLQLSPDADQVAFSYCSMTFKLPVEKMGSNVCNVDPEYGGAQIRSMVELMGHSNLDLLPVLFKLVEATEGGNCVVFGQDVATQIEQIIARPQT